MFEEFSNDLDKRTGPNEYLYKLEENQAFQNQLIKDLRSQLLEKDEENQIISKQSKENQEKEEKKLLLEMKKIKEENKELIKVLNEFKQKNKLIFEENKQFVHEVENLRELTSKIRDDKDNLDHVTRENYEEIAFLKKELERTRNLKDDLSGLMECNNEKIQLLEREIEEGNNKINGILEEKMNIERIELKDQEIIRELEKNNISLIDENKQQRDYIAKLEGQFNYLKNEQLRVTYVKIVRVNFFRDLMTLRKKFKSSSLTMKDYMKKISS